MRNRLFVLVALACAMPSLADQPTAGDLITFDEDACALIHIDPTTGIGDVISRWGSSICGVPVVVVGNGPIDWHPDFANSPSFIRPDGWIYVVGEIESPPNGFGWFRIHPGTGDRELLTVFESVIPEHVAIWPEPSFFSPPAVAALSMGGVVLLGVALIGFSKRKGGGAKHDS